MNAPGGDWQPAASLEHLRLRAGVLTRLRAFFADRGVLEVETPLLLPAIAPEPQLQYMRVHPPAPDVAERWLPASPEAQMKRLLAAGSGAIYQLGRAFRQEEQGTLHNPEFTLLEWYRPGWEERQLMEEVAELAQGVLGDWPVEYRSYAGLFAEHVGLHPHRSSSEELLHHAQTRVDISLSRQTLHSLQQRDVLLQFLFSECVERHLGGPRLVFVCEYPAEQAALTALGKNAEGDTVARRFELYAAGVELANGGRELCDAEELERRFSAEREHRGAEAPPPDRKLLAALRTGLPPCAGVALGVDRLVMLAAGCSSIREVLAFPQDRS